MRKVNQATSASCKTIASLAISAFTSSSCVCFAFSAGIALTTKIVPPILSEGGEGLGNRACNVFHFRTSVIQVLKKLKSRDSNGRDYLSQSFLPRRCLDCSFRAAALSSRSLRSCASLILKSSLTFFTKISTSFGKCSSACKNGWHFSLSRSYRSCNRSTAEDALKYCL